MNYARKESSPAEAGDLKKWFFVKWTEFPCHKLYCYGMPGFLTYMELMIDDHTVCMSNFVIFVHFLLAENQLRLIRGVQDRVELGSS